MQSRKWIAKEYLSEFRDLNLTSVDYAFLHLYIKASVYNDRRACQELVGSNLGRKLSKEFNQKWLAKGRDIMIKWVRQGSQAESNCGRCLKNIEVCTCVIPVRETGYADRDWRTDYLQSSPEDDIIEYLDDHEKAFDLRPYGNAPLDLPKGTTVRLAIARHLLQNMLGQIISFREADQKYEVMFFRGRESFRMYVQPDEIKLLRKSK